MKGLLHRLVFEFGNIELITLRRVDGMSEPTSLRLEMHGAVVEFSAVAADDSLALIELNIQEGDVGSTPSPWLPLVGGKVTWAWILTNHLGFEDGAQLLVATRERGEVVVQILVEASALKFTMFHHDQALE